MGRQQEGQQASIEPSAIEPGADSNRARAGRAGRKSRSKAGDAIVTSGIIILIPSFLASLRKCWFKPFYTASIRFAKLGQGRCVDFLASTHMSRDPSEAPAHNFAEALQADASLGSFGELLRQVVDSPALSADASSDETPGFSNASHYSDSVQQTPQGLGADVEALAQHAQQEAARFQLTERERRERNKAAQAAYRQRKRVSFYRC